jgi:transcriptional regulator with XRE-family HTH domain
MVDRSYISRLESGSRMPARETLEAITRALRLTDVEQERLFLAAGYVPAKHSLRRLEGFLGRFVDAYQAASLEAQQAVGWTLNAVVEFLEKEGTTNP